jgi:Domain of unknown function (DUF4296)
MRKFLIFFFLLFCFACQKQVEVTTISDETIAKIMLDISLAEAGTHTLTGYPKDSLSQIYYEQVFKINKISKEEYEKNIRIVGRDVDRMMAILDISEKMLLQKQKK